MKMLKRDGLCRFLPALTALAIILLSVLGVALMDGCLEDRLDAYGTRVENPDGDGKCLVQVKAGEVAQVTARILAELPVLDLTVEDPPIESVIERAFSD